MHFQADSHGNQWGRLEGFVLEIAPASVPSFEEQDTGSGIEVGGDTPPGQQPDPHVERHGKSVELHIVIGKEGELRRLFCLELFIPACESEGHRGGNPVAEGECCTGTDAPLVEVREEEIHASLDTEGPFALAFLGQGIGKRQEQDRKYRRPGEPDVHRCLVAQAVRHG